MIDPSVEATYKEALMSTASEPIPAYARLPLSQVVGPDGLRILKLTIEWSHSKSMWWRRIYQLATKMQMSKDREPPEHRHTQSAFSLVVKKLDGMDTYRVLWPFWDFVHEEYAHTSRKERLRSLQADEITRYHTQLIRRFATDADRQTFDVLIAIAHDLYTTWVVTWPLVDPVRYDAERWRPWVQDPPGISIEAFANPATFPLHVRDHLLPWWERRRTADALVLAARSTTASVRTPAAPAVVPDSAPEAVVADPIPTPLVPDTPMAVPVEVAATSTPASDPPVDATSDPVSVDHLREPWAGMHARLAMIAADDPAWDDAAAFFAAAQQLLDAAVQQRTTVPLVRSLQRLAHVRVEAGDHLAEQLEPTTTWQVADFPPPVHPAVGRIDAVTSAVEACLPVLKDPTLVRNFGALTKRLNPLLDTLGGAVSAADALRVVRPSSIPAVLAATAPPSPVDAPVSTLEVPAPVSTPTAPPALAAPSTPPAPSGASAPAVEDPPPAATVAAADVASPPAPEIEVIEPAPVAPAPPVLVQPTHPVDVVPTRATPPAVMAAPAASTEVRSSSASARSSTARRTSPVVEAMHIPTPQEVAAQILAGTAGEDPIADLAWSLAAAGELPIACHLFTARSTLQLRPDVPDWICKLAIGGPTYRYEDMAFDHVIATARNALAGSVWITNHGDWNTGIRLLCTAGLIRPALMAPHTGAAVALTHLHLGDGPLSKLIQHVIAKQGRRNTRLDRRAILYARSAEARDREVDDLRRRARTILDEANGRRLMGPARTIWSRWFEYGGPLQRMFSAIAEARRNEIPWMVDEIAAWEGNLVARIDETDDRTTGRDKIRARCSEQLQTKIRAILPTAQAWVALHPTQGDSRPIDLSEVDRIRTDIRELLPAARAEAGQQAAAKDGAPAQAGLRALHRALDDLNRLFDPEADGEPEHRELEEILDGALLRVTDLPVDAEGDIAVALEALTQHIVSVLQRGPIPSSIAAAQIRIDAWDFHGAQHILDHIDAADPQIDVLRQRIAVEKPMRRRDVAGQVECCQLKLAKGLMSSVISENDHDDLKHTVDSVMAAVEQDEVSDFRQARQTLDETEQEINRQTEDALRSMRERLAGIPPDHPCHERIRRALDAQDILAATDLLNRYESGDHTVEPEVELDHLHAFCRDMRQIRQVISESGPKCPQQIEDLAKAIEAGTDFHTIRTAAVREDASRRAKLLRSWLTVFRCAGNGDTRSLVEPVTAFLQQFDFNLLPGGVSVDTRSNGRHVLSVQVQTISDRTICPVHACGSSAKGCYTLLVLRESSLSVTEILAAVRSLHASNTDTVLVCHNGALSVERRMELALCMRNEDGRKLPRTLVIDHVVMAHMATSEVPRRAMFYATLPFAYVRPHVTSAGLVPPEIFYGRTYEREQITNPDGSCIVYGGRQLGKTALLLDIAAQMHQPERNSVALWLDIRDTKSADEVRQVWVRIGRELRAAKVIPASTPEHAGTDVLADHIVQWVKTQPNARVLLMLDEADRFLEYDATTDFSEVGRFKNMMMATERRFKVVFAGLHQVRRSAMSANNHFLHLGEPLCIGPLMRRDAREARKLIEEPLAAVGYRFEHEVLVQNILAHTNYYPSLIQIYCEKLLQYLVTTASWAGQTVPPFIITREHIDRAYLDLDLRSEISKRFNHTITLDNRFNVIALTIATDMNRGRREPWTVSELSVKANDWWPSGFAYMTDLEDFRALCDEMDGLGVLRRMRHPRHGTTYALRSPTILPLLGSPREVETKLVAAASEEAKAEFSALVSRSALSGGLRAPLTQRQSTDLVGSDTGTGSGAVIIPGSLALDLDRLKSFVKDRISAPIHEMSVMHQKSHFESSLRDLAKRDKTGTEFWWTSNESAWDLDWVDLAQSRAKSLHHRHGRVRFVFPLQPSHAWHRRAHFIGSPRPGVTVIPLTTWNEDVVVDWIRETFAAADAGPEERRRIAKLTGGWPVILRSLSDKVQSGITLSAAVKAVDQELETPPEILLMKFGLRVGVAPYLRPYLDMAELPITPGDMAQTLAGSEVRATEDDCRLVLRWAETYSLVRPLVGSTPAAPAWIMDPIVARLLRRMA